MAKDVKSSLIRSIKTDTKTIAENSKHFGPKLPSADESSEREEHISNSLDELSQVIVGSFAQLVFGQSGKHKVSELLGLLGTTPDNTIFGNIEDIAKMFGANHGIPDKRVEFGKQFASGIVENSKYWELFKNTITAGIACAGSVCNEIAVRLTCSKNMVGLISFLEEITKNKVTRETFKNLESLKSLKLFIDCLNDVLSDESFNIDLVGDRLYDLTEIVENELHDLLDAITNELKTKKETTKFESINFNIKTLCGLRKLLPTWMTLFKMSIKLQMLTGFTIDLQKLSKAINDIPKINMSKSSWSDMTDKHIASLVAIGDTLSVIDTKKYRNIIKQNIVPYVNDIIDLFEKIDSFSYLNIDFDRLKEINSYFISLSKLPVDKLPKQADLLKLLDIENIINAFTENFKDDAFAMDDRIDQLITNLETIIIAFSQGGLIGQHLSTIVQINKDDIAKLHRLTEYFGELDILAKKLTIIDKLTGNIDEDAAKTGLVKLANSLEVAVNKFNSIDINQERAEGLNKYINTIAKFVIAGAGILLFGAMMMAIIPVANVALFAITLGSFVWGIMSVYKTISKDSNLAFEGAKGFTLIIAVGAAVLLLGAKVMESLDKQALIEFTILHAFFLTAMSLPYKLFAKDSRLTYDGAEAFTLLLIASTALIIGGSIFFNTIDWDSATKFVVATSAFVLSMSLIYAIPYRIGLFDTAVDAIEDFTILMIATAGTVIAGSIFYKYIDWDSTSKFITSTALFALSLVSMFGLPRMLGKLIPGPLGAAIAQLDPFKSALEGVRDFAILIAATGLTLAIGAYIAKHIPFDALMQFTVTLGGFMLAVIGPLIMMKGSIRMAKHTGEEFAKIIVISAATMIIGGLLFTWFPQIKKGVQEFAFVHGLYLLAITTSLSLLKRARPEQMLKNATMLMIVTVVSAASLLFAGVMMDKYPSMSYNVPIFTGCLILYIAAMGTVAWLLSKAEKDMYKGVIVIGLLVATTLMATLAISLAAQMAEKYSWAALGKGILALISGIGLIAVAYWGMGYLGFADGGIGLGLAAVVLTAVSALTFMTVSALVYVANNMNKIKSANLDEFETIIKKFGKLGRALTDEFGSLKMMIKLPMVSACVISLSFALSSIARSVKEYADLKIPIYEGTKIVGYRSLTKDDFTTASENIKSVIETLGKPIEEIAKDPKRMKLYEETSGFLGIGAQKSSFAKVINGNMRLGELISKIAKGVKEYADLRIPIYKGTEVVGYRSLTKEDFDAASANIGLVINTLGKPIRDIAANPKQMKFYEETSGFLGIGAKKSSFAKVINGNIKLAELISKIASAVKDFVNLQIPTGFDKDGKATGYRSMNADDFIKASTNISTILACVGEAIKTTVKDNSELFGDSGGWFGGNSDPKASPAYRAALAMSEITKPIATMADIMAMYSMGIFPYTTNSTDANGKQIVKTSNIKINFNNVKKNIKNVLLALISPLHDIITDSQYKDTVLKRDGDKTKGQLTAEQINSMANTITAVTKSMKNFGDIAITDSTEKLKTIKESLKSMLTEVLGIATLFISPEGKSNGKKSLFEQLSKLDAKDNISALCNKINMFTGEIKQLVDVVDYSKETGSEGYQIIMNGLDGIMTKIAVMPSGSNFAENVKQLENYVNTINKIDLSKVIRLNDLGNTLNILAARMGNLDKLTEALSDKLAAVLDRLVSELKLAAKTVKSADSLQKKRHEAIRKAVKEVQKIMDQSMLVEIRQVQDESSALFTGGSSSSGGGSSSSAAPASGGGNYGGGETSGNSEYSTETKDGKSVTIKTSDRNSSTGGNKVNNINNGGPQISAGAIEEAILNAIRRAKNQNILK